MHFITFSRKMGTNGSEIARQVANKLGYQFYDTEAIEKTAREMGFLVLSSSLCKKERGDLLAFRIQVKEKRKENSFHTISINKDPQLFITNLLLLIFLLSPPLKTFIAPC